MDKRFRVVVVGIAPGQSISQRELVNNLSARLPLPIDARMALEAGRSAVVHTAETEAKARKAATILIRLGAEVRIEPETVAVGGSRGLDFGAPDLDFGAVDLDDSGDAPPELALAPPELGAAGDHLGYEEHTLPTLHERTRPPLEAPVSSPDDSPTRVTVRGPDSRQRGSAGLPPPAPRSEPKVPPPDTARPPPAPPAPRPPAARAVSQNDQPTDRAWSRSHAPEDGPPGHPAGANERLVRCPAHGLLYDASTSTGCSRCLGPQPKERFRLAPRLRQKTQAWLTLGVFLALLLGAVPAVLYTEFQKNGPLLEQRIEAEAIRQRGFRAKDVQARYRAARHKVDHQRIRGVAFTALIWIGTTLLLLFFWYRFV